VRRSALFCALLASSACSSGSGTVSVDGIDDFGPVGSALWLLSEPVPLWQIGDTADEPADLGEAWFDPLNLRDGLWSCAAEQAYVARWGELSTAALAAHGSGERGAWCDAITELERHQATRPAAYRRFSAPWNTNGGETGSTPPEAGDAAADADGFLSYVEDAGEACPRWDAEACAYTGGDDTCADHTRYWWAEEGDFRIEEADEEVVAGSFEGTLVAVEDDAASGAISVDFRAAICELETVSALLITP
jgi:hypothetical protein